MAKAEDIIHVSDRGGVKLVRFRATAVLNEAEADALGRGLLALTGHPGQRVVLSFLGVHQLSSLVLGKLIQLHKRLSESGGELRLADIEPHTYEVFTITRLDRLFRIFEREDEAVASFLGQAEA